MKTECSKRVLSFDVMRIVAAFAIVVQHAGGQFWEVLFPSAEWEIRNFYISLVQWGVPVFIMISGALFLSPDKPLVIRRLFSKNILRIVYAFLFWSVIYTLVTEGLSQGLKIAFISALKGPPHFWFLKIIIGIYLILPVLKSIAADEKAFNYLVGFVIITTFVISSIFNHVALFNQERMQAMVDYYSGYGLASLNFTAYFIIGHWLFSHTISSWMKTVIYFMAVISFMGSAVATHWLSHYFGSCQSILYDDLHPFVLIQGVAVFIFFRDRFMTLSPQWKRIVVKLSNCSFGIYLVHPLLIYLFTNFFGLSSSTFSVVWFAPVYIIFIFILSYLLVRLISLIPFMRKFVM